MVKFSNNFSPIGFTPKKYRISVEQYYRMDNLGFFENKKVELIDGEIYTMSPITPNHASHVDKIALFLTVSCFKKAIIRTQSSINIDDASEPEPDIAVLKMDKHFYNKAHPTPEDIYLLIEVSIFTVSHDRKVKMKNYATCNIPEYWMVIPQKGVIEIYRKPKNGKYTEKKICTIKDSWTFKPFKLKVKGSDLLI